MNLLTAFGLLVGIGGIVILAITAIALLQGKQAGKSAGIKLVLGISLVAAGLACQLPHLTGSGAQGSVSTGNKHADALRKRLEDFPKKLMSENFSNCVWSVKSYNITKTDSLISPLLADVSVGYRGEIQLSPQQRIKGGSDFVFVLALQDEKWVMKSLKQTVFLDDGTRGEAETIDLGKTLGYDVSALKNFMEGN